MIFMGSASDENVATEFEWPTQKCIKDKIFQSNVNGVGSIGRESKASIEMVLAKIPTKNRPVHSIRISATSLLVQWVCNMVAM